MSSLLSLPPELLLQIARVLPPRAHYALALTSRTIFNTLQSLLEQHKSLSPLYKRIGSRHGRLQNTPYQLWNYLSIFLGKKELAEYVESMEISLRDDVFDDSHEDRGFYESLVYYPEYMSESEAHQNEDIEVQGLIESLDILGYVAQGIWRNNVLGDETEAMKADREYLEETNNEETIPEISGLPLDHKNDSYGLGTRAPKWYASMENDPWFADIPRPPFPYSQKYLNPEGRDDTHVNGRNPLKQMVYNGGESPIVAKLLVISPNLETINISLRMSDYCLLMALKNIHSAYSNGPSFDGLPLSRLKRVTLTAWSYWQFEILPLFTDLPSVEEIRINNHGKYPSALQRAQFPLDEEFATRGNHQVKSFILQSVYPEMHWRYLRYFDRVAVSQAFYVSYNHSSNLFELLVYRSLRKTIKYLWFAPMNWIVHPKKAQETRYDPEFWKPRGEFEPIDIPFPILHTLHCPWSDIVRADRMRIKLLVPSLRRLLITQVLIDEESVIIGCLDLLPNLQEFGAHTFISSERHRNEGGYITSTCYPTSNTIKASSGAQLPKLREEILRRRVKWLSFEEKCNLEHALTGS